MRWYIVPTLVFAAAFAGPFTARAEPPRLGLEFTVGQNVGLSSYVDNVVLLEDDVPLLADELPGTGIDIGLAIVFSNVELGMSIHFYDRERVVLHHRGTSTISDRNRLRPDGSVDDSGVEYEAIERATVQSPSRNNGDFLFGQFSGGYRWYLLKRDFSLFVPLSGGIGFATVLESSQPLSFGLQAETGLGGSYEIADPLGLVFDARLGGLITPVYGNVSDAARTGAVDGRSTESTVVSTFAQFSFSVGIVIKFR